MVMFSRSEAEEEGIINKLMKRMAELKKEKEAIAIEAEREEEARAHGLSVGAVGMGVLKDGKTIDPALTITPLSLFRQTTTRQQMISNTLQRRLMAVLKEKIDLGNQLEQEQEQIVNKLTKEITKLRQEKAQLALDVEREEEMLTNTMMKKLDAERREKEALESRLHVEVAHVSSTCGVDVSACLCLLVWMGLSPAHATCRWLAGWLACLALPPSVRP